MEVSALVDILMSVQSETPELYHTPTAGTPFFWCEAVGDKDKGPLTDEDIDNIAEAKKKDPATAKEVFTNLFLGNKAAAEDIMYIKDKGITLVINMAARSLRSKKFEVIPDQEGLSREGIELKTAPEWSEMNITECFDQIGDWIAEETNRGGQVLIGCWQGHNRSATVVIAYLMKHQKMGLKEAMIMVKEKRDIRPNNSFLKQLIDYQEKLILLH